MLALAAGCTTPAPVGADTAAPAGAVTAASSVTPETDTTSSQTATPTLRPSTDDHGALPTSIQPVASGEVTAFRITRGGTTTMDAQSSGLARYNTSDRCEVPGQPCYDAPTFDKVARIDLGAPPTVPGEETTFITGHSNRYRPDDPSRGVFSRLQNVRTGDVIVLTTTTGVFVYDVTATLSVPFDQLTTTPEAIDVRPDTVVAISCVIAPTHDDYLGNYVVVGSLRASAPA